MAQMRRGSEVKTVAFVNTLCYNVKSYPRERSVNMNYIIFDLEWNQPADVDATVTEPLYLPGEIIEIGAVKLNEQFQPIDELRTLVIPQYYKKMHRRIASLTGIYDRDLAERGLPFPEAYAHFSAWCGEEYAYMTWSMSDIPVLIDNMLLHGIDVSGLPVCYDLQRIFDREIMRGNMRYSLESALAILKEDGETAHDALNDAHNTVKVCAHLDLDVYLDEYASKVFGEQPNGVVYESRKEVMETPDLREFSCPWCGQVIQCDEWIPSGHGPHWGYCMCPEGDEFLIELSIYSPHKNSFCAKRVFRELSDDLWDIYMERKETQEAKV